MNERDDTLVGFLSERDVACPGCGYNLRGLVGRVCPECGKPAASLFARPWWKFTKVERSFAGGLAGSLLAIVACVVAIVLAASDPFWVIALWVPAIMLVGWMFLASMWTGWLIHVGRRHPRLAVANAVVVWCLAAAYWGFVSVLIVSML